MAKEKYVPFAEVFESREGEYHCLKCMYSTTLGNKARSHAASVHGIVIEPEVIVVKQAKPVQPAEPIIVVVEE